MTKIKMPYRINPSSLTADLLATPKLKAAHKRWSDAMDAVTRFDVETETQQLRQQQAQQEYKTKLAEAAKAGTDLTKIPAPVQADPTTRNLQRNALVEVAQEAATSLRDEFSPTIDKQIEEAQADLATSTERVKQQAAAFHNELKSYAQLVRRLKYLRGVQRSPDELPPMGFGSVAPHHVTAINSILASLDWRDQDDNRVRRIENERERNQHLAESINGG